MASVSDNNCLQMVNIDVVEDEDILYLMLTKMRANVAGNTIIPELPGIYLPART
jgi:hypothetical protein